ncbi:hypothetical protein [Nostocoides sp. HKS02]|uniref:hypothetical protein n=1 Tax=Nostocoides sp. HKS02 TaxID=1813880 RepID=UPI0012B4771E|nr:hypothetical protein [Tetrasphaera sp. HKS02]QGN56583.1 hypothetical protein GKE56_00210 [Tetrasphaera sp. HKS02]
MDTQGSLDSETPAKPLVSRRTVAIGAAWSVPVILAVTATPAAAASLVAAVEDAGQGSLKHTKNQTYLLTLFFTVTGPVGATVPITVTNVSTTTVPGPVEFTVVPQTVNVPVGVNSATYAFERQGNNSALTATVTYIVNGGAAQTATVPVVM